MITHKNIDDAIECITGLRPELKEDGSTYKITLGTKRPFVLQKRINLGYGVGDHYYALRITLLQSVAEAMHDPDGFQNWVNENKPTDDDTK